MQNGFNVNKRQHEKLIHNKKKLKLNMRKKEQKPIKRHKKTETHNNTFCNRRNVSKPKQPGILNKYFFPK